jgi:ribose transport system substrate-binding protein
MVGLFAYNTPAVLEALKQAGKLGAIRVVAFDEADETLQGIKDRTVFGTVVQDPYGYGYRSIEVLHGLTRGESGVVPASGFIEIPARKIYFADVDEFLQELRRKLVRNGG